MNIIVKETETVECSDGEYNIIRTYQNGRLINIEYDIGKLNITYGQLKKAIDKQNMRQAAENE